MEFINRIELAGVVGMVRRQKVSDKTVANFSMVTEEYYHSREGAVIETTWFNVVAWQGDDCPDLDKIEKGSHVNVKGRFRARRYVDNYGNDRSTYDVVAREVTIIQ